MNTYRFINIALSYISYGEGRAFSEGPVMSVRSMLLVLMTLLCMLFGMSATAGQQDGPMLTEQDLVEIKWLLRDVQNQSKEVIRAVSGDEGVWAFEETHKSDDEPVSFRWKKVGANPVIRYIRRHTKGKSYKEGLEFTYRHTSDSLRRMHIDPDKNPLAYELIANHVFDAAVGLSTEGKQALRETEEKARSEGKVRDDKLVRGDRFVAVNYDGGKAEWNAVADWTTGPEDAIKIKLEQSMAGLSSESYDQWIDWAKKCGNIVVRPPEWKQPPPRRKVPPGKHIPPVRLPPEEEVVKEYLWDADAFAYYGQDIGSARAQTQFWGGEVALYPFVWDTPDGRHELGLGGMYGGFEGRAFDGFRFDGSQWGVSPAYKFYGKGWDFNLKAPMFGELDEHGKSADGRYRSEREFDLLGVGAGYNNYERQVRGEKWFPEYQIFGRVGFPIGSQVSHSYDGQGIADTRELRNFDGLVNVGVRLFIWDGDYVRPYVEAGYFGEEPTNRSLRAQIGVSDHRKIVFCGLGPNFNLTHGGESFLWSCGIDPFNLGRYIRGEYRRDQFRKTLSNYDDETGGFTLPEDGAAAAPATSPSLTPAPRIGADAKTGGFTLPTDVTGGGDVTQPVHPDGWGGVAPEGFGGMPAASPNDFTPPPGFNEFL